MLFSFGGQFFLPLLFLVSYTGFVSFISGVFSAVQRLALVSLVSRIGFATVEKNIRKGKFTRVAWILGAGIRLFMLRLISPE